MVVHDFLLEIDSSSRSHIAAKGYRSVFYVMSFDEKLSLRPWVC